MNDKKRHTPLSILNRREFIRIGSLSTAGIYTGVTGTQYAGSLLNQPEEGWPELKVNWMKTARIFALEQWWPPYWPHLTVDWDKALWTMKRLNLDTLQANALTKTAFYQTDLIRNHPELGDRDILKESSEFCIKHGFSMIMYSLFGHAMPISTQLSKKYGAALFEPMFKMRGPQNTAHTVNVPEEFKGLNTRWHFGGEPYVAHCVFSMEKWLLEHATELAENYEYQAAWIDSATTAGDSWTNDSAMNICTCTTCRDAYREDFSGEMPQITDLNDGRVIPMRRWIQQRLDSVMGRVHDILTKGTIMPLIGNFANGGGEVVYYPEYIRHLDGGLFEHAPDMTDKVQKLGMSRHMVSTAIHYPDSYDAFPRRVTSGWELENKGLTILSFDGTPYLAQPGKYYYDDHNDEPAKRIFNFMDKAKPLLSGQKHDAYAAVMSVPFYSGNKGPHQKYSRGWTRLMLDRHILPTTIPSYLNQMIDQCKDIPVMILPDVQVLSDKEIESLLSFTRNGGGVYISGHIGRLDENNKVRPPESLIELLDLEPWDDNPEAKKRRAIFDDYKGFWATSRTYDIYASVKDPGNGFPIPDEFSIGPAELRGLVPGSSWKVCSQAIPTDNEVPLMPILAIKQVGEGRMVYAGSPFEAQYHDRRNDELGEWMKDLLVWLGNKPLPIEVEAPKILQMGSTILDQGDRLIYLINQSNDIQQSRKGWWDMMQVWDRPYPMGRVSITTDGNEIETIYGPSPDEIRENQGKVTAIWNNFTDHVVVHAKV